MHAKKIIDGARNRAGDQKTLGKAKSDQDVINSLHASSIHFLWIVLDGIGLAIIASCTLFDAFHEWRDTFQYHYEHNAHALSLWLLGRILQVGALLTLMFYAATLNSFPSLEWVGMFLLTTGPMMCLSSALLFESDPSLSDHFCLDWFSSELLELSGIIFLDLSMLDLSSNELELAVEVIGFALLIAAAVLDFTFTVDGATLPLVDFKLDMITISDSFGLLLLTFVGVADYRARVNHEALVSEGKANPQASLSMEALNFLTQSSPSPAATTAAAAAAEKSASLSLL